MGDDSTTKIVGRGNVRLRWHNGRSGTRHVAYPRSSKEPHICE